MPLHFQIGGFVIFVSMIIARAEKPAEASPMQVCSYHANQSLINQSLIIRNIDDRGSLVCKFNFTMVPYSLNCTQPGTFVCVKNESYVLMFTEDQKTKNWMMEYGSGLNGHDLSATCRDTPENTVRDKVSECFKSADTPAQPRRDDDRHHTVWIILGVLLVVAALTLFLYLLYKFCKRFNRWVNAAFSRLRGCKMRSFNKTGTTSNANARSSPNEGDVSVPLAPIERG